MPVHKRTPGLDADDYYVAGSTVRRSARAAEEPTTRRAPDRREERQRRAQAQERGKDLARHSSFPLSRSVRTSTCWPPRISAWAWTAPVMRSGCIDACLRADVPIGGRGHEGIPVLADGEGLGEEDLGAE